MLGMGMIPRILTTIPSFQGSVTTWGHDENYPEKKNGRTLPWSIGDGYIMGLRVKSRIAYPKI